MDKETDAFRTISEVAEDLDVPKHVLRFWEVKFPQVRPMKRGGGRRYYRPEDLDLLRGIRHLLHAEGYTIKGVQKILREQGIDQVKRSWRERGAVSRAKAVIAPAKSPTSSAAKTPRADGRTRGGTAMSRRQQIEHIIAELDACRGILLGEAPVQTSRRTRRAPASG